MTAWDFNPQRRFNDMYEAKSVQMSCDHIKLCAIQSYQIISSCARFNLRFYYSVDAVIALAQCSTTAASCADGLLVLLPDSSAGANHRSGQPSGRGLSK